METECQERKQVGLIPSFSPTFSDASGKTSELGLKSADLIWIQKLVFFKLFSSVRVGSGKILARIQIF